MLLTNITQLNTTQKQQNSKHHQINQVISLRESMAEYIKHGQESTLISMMAN
jgi:hypothetical protein